MDEITQDIIDKAISGDIRSFEIVYRRYSQMVYSIAYRITGSIEDAQEVTQDVFVNIYRKFKDFQGRSSLKTWIYRIAVNMAINAYKKEGKYKTKQVAFDETWQIAGPENTTEQVLQHEQETRINKMLDLLDAGQRACLTLRSIQGLSYKEIAKALNININTVRSKLKRAREKMLLYAKEQGEKNYAMPNR